MQRSTRSTSATPAAAERALGGRPEVEHAVARQVGVEPARDLRADLVAAGPDRRADRRRPSSGAERGDAAATTPPASPRQPAWTTASAGSPPLRSDRDRHAVGARARASARRARRSRARRRGRCGRPGARLMRRRGVALAVDARAASGRGRARRRQAAGSPRPRAGSSSPAAEVERRERALADAARARRERDEVRPGRLPADHGRSSSSARASSVSRRFSAGVVDDLARAARRSARPSAGPAVAELDQVVAVDGEVGEPVRARQLLPRRPRGTAPRRASFSVDLRASGRGRAGRPPSGRAGRRRAPSPWRASSRARLERVAVAEQERVEAHDPDDALAQLVRVAEPAQRGASASSRAAARVVRRPPPGRGLPRSWKSVASRTRSGAPASAAACTTAKMCSSSVSSWSAECGSKPIAGPNSGRSATSTPVSRARRSALRGSRPSSSFDSSPIPSAASPPPIRSPETSATGARLLAHLRERRSSGSRPSWETKRRPRTSRSGSSAKLVGETVRRTPALEIGAAAVGVDELAVGESRRAIALTVKSRRREVVLDARGRVDDDLEVVPSGAGRLLAARRRELDPGRRERARLARRADRGACRPARPATTSSSTRPCGSSAARSRLAVDPGDEEVGVLRVEPEQLVAYGAADEVGVEAERARRNPRSPSQAAIPARRAGVTRARSLRSRRALPPGAGRPRRSSAPAACSPTWRA